MILRVNNKADTPVFQQIVQEVKAAIARGACREGDMLPSVRQLAATLLVNPNTVAKAYRDLEREGVVDSRRGHGVFVAAGAEAHCRADRRQAVLEKLADALADARSAGMTTSQIRAAVRQVLADELAPTT